MVAGTAVPSADGHSTLGVARGVVDMERAAAEGGVTGSRLSAARLPGRLPARVAVSVNLRAARARLEKSPEECWFGFFSVTFRLVVEPVG